MFNTQRKRTLRTALVLGALVGLWFLSAWLLSAPELNASQLLPALTFQSPIGNPQLAVDKVIDKNAPKPGEIVAYTLTYSNTNPGSQAFNIRLYDFLPAGIEVLSSAPLPVYDENGVLIFSAPSVGPGTENHVVTIYGRVRDGFEELHNHTLVVAEGVAPAHASLHTIVTPGVRELTFSKDGYTAVLTDSELIYQLRCENMGELPLDNVAIVDVLPGSVLYSNAVPAPDLVTVPMLQWSIGDLAQGDVWEATITVTTSSMIEVITNTALADAEQIVMTQTLFATQVISQGAILLVDKTASASEVRVNDELIYTLRYRNIGNEVATSVVLTDTFPADIDVTGYDIGPGTTNVNNTRGVWQLGDVAPGVSGSLMITTTVLGTPGRTLHNVADITGPGSFSDHDELDIYVRLVELYLPLIMRSH